MTADNILRMVPLIVVASACVCAFSQPGSHSRLSGVVRDASGVPLGGAHVTIGSLGGDLTVSVQSGADGTFSFPSLPTGRYSATAEEPHVPVTGLGFDPVPFFRVGNSQLECLDEPLFHPRNALSERSAVKHESIVIVDYGVSKSSSFVNEARLTFAHGEHLRESAWLPGAWHEEQIAE